MAVNIILRTVAALLAISIAVYFTTPIMYKLKADSSLWDDCASEPECLTIRDNVYQVWAFLIIPLLGTVFLWSYMASTKRDPQEYDW